MLNRKTKKTKQKGSTLIGLLVGVAIIGITFGSGLALISRNIRLASVTSHEITASALAEEGVEIIRNIRDTGDNYCIGEGEACTMTGFEKINQDGDYAIDYTTDTFDDTDILSDKTFGNSNAGLCRAPDPDNGFYTSCPLTSSPEFIRKITLEPSHADCQGTGVLTTVTVYWKEFWDRTTFPGAVADLEDAGLYQVQVKKCMYDWRPQ